ncbi:MAG: hypothetical protein JWQ23_1191 [Herminiimonas sp.]|nr:hypothetical protein [Herminiimonas sp.]
MRAINAGCMCLAYTRGQKTGSRREGKREVRADRTRRKKTKQADRPDSVTAPGEPGAMTAIHLGLRLLAGSSFLPARSASNIIACLFGIAPGGGYRVSPFVNLAGLRRVPEDSSLWPCSAPCDGRPLAVTLLYGVRTFLPPSLLVNRGCNNGQRLSGLLQPYCNRSRYLIRYKPRLNQDCERVEKKRIISFDASGPLPSV